MDTEGRHVELVKPLYDLYMWNIRIDGVSKGAVLKDSQGQWVRRSIFLTLEDFDALVWIVEQHEASKVQ
jgi:hypothetical protein